MPASATMTVALVLTAVNNMPSVLSAAGKNVQSFASQITKAGDDVSRYDQKIKKLEDRITKFNKLKTSGMQDMRSGMMMLAPVEEALRQAANLEGVMTKVGIAMYDSNVPLAEQQERMKALTQQAAELGNETVFSNIEAGEAQLALLRNGMTYLDLMEGGTKASMYLAQTAEIAPSAAADAVSQITNMFQLQGNQLFQVADDINRAAGASSAGVLNIMNDLQQSGTTAHTLGLQVKETGLMLGTLHNMGLGDSSGTYLNDMLVNLDKVTPKARKAMQNMGWLEGATVKTLSSGNVKIIGGSNSLFDENGQIRSAEMLVKKLREALYTNTDLKPEDLRDQSGNLLPQEEIERILGAKNKLEAMQQFKDVLGIQGMRAGLALSTPGKGSYEEMVAQAERAQNIQDQVLAWQDTLLGKVETLKGSWETLMTQSGTPLTNEVGGMVTSVTKMVTAAGDWANANPKLVSSLIKLLGALATGRIMVGSIKYLIGWTGEFTSGIAKGFEYAGKGISFATRHARGFYDSFKYFRQGAGVFRSLWQAAAFGHPTLTRVIATVVRFGGNLLKLGTQGLVMGARLAAAWLIGLGPVGWIIAGVTAAVIAGIAAWKTNFGGFRDFCLGILRTIVGWINTVRTSLGMTAIELDVLKDRSSMGSFKQLEYAKPAVVGMGSDTAYSQANTFNIQSTDPKGAAAEVSSILGIDKYKQSRDPRLQLGFAMP